MPIELPNNIDELKKIIWQKQDEINALKEIIEILRRGKFGKSSEKVHPNELGTFNEAESEAADSEDDPDELISVPAHERRRGKRLVLSENLPRVEVIIDIDDKSCSVDGKALQLIGEEISEKLEIIPATVRVIRTIRKKYSCPFCQGVREAKAPLDFFPKSNASPSLLAYVAVAKYVDGLPLYRQEGIFKRIGVDLPRQTMARWMIDVGKKLAPLVTLLREELLQSHYIQMDETVVQVLREEGKKAGSNSYMWVQARWGPRPIVLYHYAKNRSADNPRQLLEDFNGALQVDGYDGYAPVVAENKITRLGCWAHARRKFFTAFKSSSGKGIGKIGLEFFRKIYKLEESWQDKTSEEKFIGRIKYSIPIAKEFKDWMEKQKIPPESLGGKAIKYALGEWEYLMNCFCGGDYRLDNNMIESHIRPFTIGRKNWLFSVRPEGAEASAIIYSLVESAKANGVEPFEYLKNVFERFPAAQSESDFLKLLPFKA